MVAARFFSRVSLVALAILGAGNAAHADSLVISGYGPSVSRSGSDEALIALNNARVQTAYTQAALPPDQPARLPASPPARGRYGGGFIEFLVSGQNGGGVVYNQPVSNQPVSNQPVSHQPVSHQPDLARVQALAPQNASYDPLERDPGLARRPVNPVYQRQEVDYTGAGKPGTLVIDTPNKFLFLVEPGGRALRYGIGVGRPGFEWAGVKTISRKAEWPDWTPPPDMLLRRPDLPRHMDGGPANPLGARALYLGSSLYRIHGTNEPATIGTNVSSGCIRMMNQDVIDLYGRVGVGTRVIVM
jgi:lipoprotein-anchoring transpeptidase ErfK/SrfK